MGFSIPDGHSGKADSRGRDGHGVLFSAGIHVHQGQVYAFYGRAHGGNVELDSDIVPKMEFIPVRNGDLARYLPCPVKIPHTTHSTDSVVLVKHMDTISVHRVSPAYLDGLSGSLLAAKLTSREIGTARIFTIGSPVAGWLQGGHQKQLRHIGKTVSGRAVFVVAVGRDIVIYLFCIIGWH